MDTWGEGDAPSAYATISPRAADWAGAAIQGIGALLAAGVGLAYFFVSPIHDWIDSQFRHGKSGVNGILMRLPAPAWASLALAVAVVLVFLALKEARRAAGAAIVLCATPDEVGLTLTAGPWSDAEGSLRVPSGASLAVAEGPLEGGDAMRIVFTAAGVSWPLTCEASVEEWDLSDVLSALDAQGSRVEGL